MTSDRRTNLVSSPQSIQFSLRIIPALGDIVFRVKVGDRWRVRGDSTVKRWGVSIFLSGGVLQELGQVGDRVVSELDLHRHVRHALVVVRRHLAVVSSADVEVVLFLLRR